MGQKKNDSPTILSKIHFLCFHRLNDMYFIQPSNIPLYTLKTVYYSQVFLRNKRNKRY